MIAHEHGPDLAYRDWMRDAECQTLWDAADEIFYPVPGSTRASRIEMAQHICSECPVRRECLEHALRIEGSLSCVGRFGIFGGATPSQRAEIAKTRRTTVMGAAA